jgi:hypothetical protein
VGAGTVSASLYSFYTLATAQDPLTPSVYNGHSGMRTLFLTVGREEADSTSQTTSQPGTIYGGRWLPLNRRDASSIAKDPAAMKQFREVAKAIAGGTSEAASAVVNLLYDRLPEPKPTRLEFLRSLQTPADVQNLVDHLDFSERAQVTALIRTYRNRMAAADKELQTLIGMLARRWQVAVDFQTTQRADGANNDYQSEIIADRALNDRCFFTFNGSYLYSDSAKIGADTRTGRGAFELQYKLTHVGATSLRNPMQLSMSGEGLYKQQMWQYHAQMQLMIPLAAGVNLPFSFGYGNRTDLLHQQQRDVFGKFGLTLDIAKVVSSLKN